MSSVAGLLRVGGRLADPAEVEGMLDALAHWPPDGRGAWVEGPAGLGHLMLHNTPESLGEAQPYRESDSEEGPVITADARIDNRAELADLLGIAAADLPAWPDSRLILRAYERWGEACVHHLVGDFAFGIWDSRRQRMFCACDPMGVKPLYYYHGRDGFAFATEIKGLLALDWVDRSINELWIADLLARIYVDRDRTMYEHILVLDAAHVLSVSAEGLRRSRYWDFPSPPELHLSTDAEYVDAFEEHFQRAIERRLRTAFSVGAELSGGLDSSGISAVAHRLLTDRGQTLATFSQVKPPAPAELGLPDDERASVELLVEHAGMPEPHFLTGEGIGVEDAIEWAATHFDEPPTVTISTFKDQLFARAEPLGIRVVLSGFGGNQGVTMGGGGAIRDHARNRHWRYLMAELTGPARFGAIEQVRQAAFSRLGTVERAIRRWRVRRTAHHRKLRHRALRTDLVERYDLYERLMRHHELRSTWGTPRESMARMLARPDAAARLRYANLAAAGRRMEFRYPMLDVELLSFFLAVPSRLKYRRGTGRLLFRMALERWAPEGVAWRNSPASANPGEIARRHFAQADLRNELATLADDHPMFAFVDPAKIGTEMRLDTPDGPIRWRRTNQMVTLTILERKLREAARS